MSLGNTKLIEHGIQNEHSHLRAHVCPKARKVYIFPTVRGLEAIQSGKYPHRNGYQQGVATPTAGGYLVPPMEINQCIAVSLRPVTWDALCFPGGNDQASLRQKGRTATRLVMAMIKSGLFPIPAIGTEIDETNLQIEGTDIIIRAGAIWQRDIVIQVKCDYPGGEKPGGTGNLYLQTEECNPFAIY